MVYVGVDLHRKRSQVVALDPAGAVVVSRRIGNAPAEFLQIFGELEPQPIEVVFEASYGWSWFADLLADVGIPAHMAHPLATKAISAARVTNDAVDAKTWPICWGPICWPRPGSLRPRPARPAGWSAPAPAWSGCAPGCSPSCTHCWPTRASSPSSPPCSARPGAADWPTCPCRLRLVADSMPACA
jgi:hypothetical protein